jgi:hypothetical protein
MRRFIRTIAVVLPLFFLAACNPSKGPEANAPTASPGASTATITASPNPVLVGQGTAGTTTITWNTGDGSEGQVYLAKDGEPEAAFATGPSGSSAAPWIQAGTTYEFRLYTGTEHTKMLAKTQVKGQK